MKTKDKTGGLGDSLAFELRDAETGELINPYPVHKRIIQRQRLNPEEQKQDCGIKPLTRKSHEDR